eukprot:gnl/MRDRNA2_/MRDRNA2_81443_c0_seq1.p1 gnl/MRDRNA2_/MRDRNA2_81443_c0~~gnl/MRDRNA2_/MRDRNA2_81443_c0_seq1.p1  ORF type:complete len:598 (+),score=126.30 gnl/MRDRNA2_/MRDRNA2_81443_c0_seq1:96-1889(+)
MSLPSATQRRLLSDLKRIQEEPIPLANARPRGDKDLTLWDAVVGVELSVPNLGLVTAPLHFVIDFPFDYPKSAPNIGFSFNFPYREGASYIENKASSRLQGKLVICLDILGNFANIHTEWKSNRGTGWTPAYTVTTLLVQLQSMLCNIGKGMSAQEQEDLYCTSLRFAEKHSSWVPELWTEEDLVFLQQERRQALRMRVICGDDQLLQQRIESFSRKAKFANDAEMMNTFLQIISDATSKSQSSSDDSTSVLAPPSSPLVDANICCFETGALYTEALLGIGVYRKGKNLGTAGELLSHEAYINGLRQSTDKSAFEFFLPVWINQTHAASNPKWSEVLQDSYLQIGQKVFNTSGNDPAILEVFPRLINQLLVEMMRPDQEKTEAIATFEALCNCWRMLRWLVDSRPSLRERILKTLTAFVAGENARHKDVSPDLGIVLVLFTVLQGFEGCPSRRDFIDAYADENFVRCVMWWQDTVLPKAAPVLEATKVSREILMFQLMLSAIVIGDNMEKTLQEIEETNCKIPDRLELLQSKWREQKSSTNTWKLFFERIGASLPSFKTTEDWIADCVQRSATKGPKYVRTQKGAGKGVKGKGKGKW